MAHVTKINDAGEPFRTEIEQVLQDLFGGSDLDPRVNYVDMVIDGKAERVYKITVVVKADERLRTILRTKLADKTDTERPGWLKELFEAWRKSDFPSDVP